MYKGFLLILLVALLPVSAYAGGGVLNILYTGALNGELEPCGCSPKTESGGLARLSGFISAARDKINPYILIDAGNSMGEDTPQGRFKADALLQAFGIMNYDAAAFFKHDRLLPPDLLSPLIEKNRIPALYGKVSHVIVERAPLKINISADPSVRILGAFNVLLADRPAAELKSIDGWDVIVTSSGEILDEPERSNGGVIVAGYPKGQKLGVLTLDLDETGRVINARHRWQGLGKEIEEDARVRGILNEYDGKVAGLLKDDERKVLADSPYIGAPRCAECHRPFADSWKVTRHAGAFGALEKAGKSKDPECVKCHTTGYMQPGGFYSMASTPNLANVQCEVCHGAGRDHAMEPSSPLKPVEESVCRVCHTKDRSPDFNFNVYYENIRHR